MPSNYHSQLYRAVASGVLIGVGLIVGGLSLDHALPAGEPFVGRLLSTIAIVVIAVPLLLSGAWIWWRDVDVDRVWRVTGWALAGMVPLTLLSLLTVYYQRIEGGHLAETWTIVAWVAGTGAVGGLLTGVYDLRRERARREARTTADRLETIVETVPIPIVVRSRDGTVTAWNSAAEEVFGWEADEVIGESYPLVPADKRTEYRKHRRRAREGAKIHGTETERRRKDGSRIDVQIWSAPRREDGELSEVILALADISELKERERALQTLHEVGRDLVRAHTVEEVFERAVDAVDRLYDEPIAGCWWYDESADRLEPICQTERATELVGDQPTFEPGGSLAWRAFDANEMAIYDDVSEKASAYDPASPMRSELILPLGKFGVMIVGETEPEAFDDLDAEIGDSLAAAMETAVERAETEEKLRLFERAIEEAGHAIVITDVEGTVEYVNPAFEETTGYSREEAEGETPRILKSGQHDEAFYEDLWETILSGDVWEGELVNQRKDGRLYRIEEVIAPITDEDGTITHFVGVQRDITARRLREQRLDVLNRILRHNLRNAMTIIQGRAAQLADALEDSELQSYASVIEEQATDLIETSEKTSTIDSLFDPDIGVDARRDIGELLTDYISSLDEEYPDARLEWSVPDGLRVQADDHLQLAIGEAVDNAVVHNDRDVPEVTVSVTPSEEGPTNDWVEIEIADNGPGIPVEEREMIERGEETSLIHGSGIGLWLIKWVVDSFGGDVTIDENDGRGSTVRLRIPAAHNQSSRVSTTDGRVSERF